MANQEHVDLLSKSVTEFNAFREEHSEVKIDLYGAYLRSADLRSAILTDADLTDANLTGTNFTGAKLSRAKLSRAKLTDAYLGGVFTAHFDQSVADTLKEMIQRQVTPEAVS